MINSRVPSIPGGLNVAVSKYCLRRFLHKHGNIATEGSPKLGQCPTLIEWFEGVLYSAQYHRQHCILQAFEQFRTQYMHNPNDKHPTRSGFEPSTSEFRVKTGPSEPSWPAFAVAAAQQIRANQPMLAWCWATVYDDGSTLSQHWFSVYQQGIINNRRKTIDINLFKLQIYSSVIYTK